VGIRNYFNRTYHEQISKHGAAIFFATRGLVCAREPAARHFEYFDELGDRGPEPLQATLTNNLTPRESLRRAGVEHAGSLIQIFSDRALTVLKLYGT
jgi:hypothetical protein